MELFKVENLSFRYSTKKENVLNDVNLKVESGEFLLLVGENGSGKSTFLKLLKDEIAPYGEKKGTINFFGKEIAFVAQNIESNIVTQKVYSELAFSLEERNFTNDEIGLKISEIASFFNLEKYFDRNVSSLSGGTKQILNIASAMVLKPDVLILDEPTSSLDPVATENLYNTLAKINNELGISIIVVEQRINKLLPLCDSIAVFENGTLSKKMNIIEGANYIKSTSLKGSLPVSAKIFNTPNSAVLTIKDAKSCLDKLLCKKEIVIKKVKTEVEKSETTLLAKDISFTYDKKEKDVFKSLNYRAKGGKINAILGGNGSGKTTLLKVLSGVYKSYSGKIHCERKIALLPQNVLDLFTKETVKEEIDGFEKSNEVISRFGLEGILNSHPYDLSGGEIQKVAVAKLYLMDADVILMDEPTASLDSVFKNKFKQLLTEMKNEGKTIVIVSHDIEFLGDVADRCAYLFGGEILESLSAIDFFSNMNYYTTDTKIITEKYFENAINIEILEKLINMNKGIGKVNEND